MILKLIIAGVILYYLVLFWLFRKGKKTVLFRKPENRKNSGAIIGRTTFRLRQVKPSEVTEGQFYKGVDNAFIFAPSDTEDTPQPMDVEFEMEYEEEVQEEDLEAEDIALIIGEEMQSARGISFEEMAQAVQVVHQEESPEEEERKAVQTLMVMQQTNLYDTVMEQINGGRLRVEEMLGKYDFVFTSPDAEAIPEELRSFDMNDYM
ncbi:hypothetical protein [Petrimonas sulfuriphila]|uniref:hypothetical protein n=1 Tax=Petrimonas sulfuriphila TaxID=285070 RepID=UPI003EB9680C